MNQLENLRSVSSRIQFRRGRTENLPKTGNWRRSPNIDTTKSIMPTSVIEISQPLASAFRMSEAFPNTENGGAGRIHLLFDEENRPVGYLVHRVNVGDAWETLDPRYFITTSHAEAVALLGIGFADLPAQEPIPA